MTTPNPKGYPRASSTGAVCEAQAIRMKDKFHDLPHWSFRRDRERAARWRKPKASALDELALLGLI